MNPVSAEAGQALQLIVMDEVRPLRGGSFLPDLVTKIAQRYRFVSVPTEGAPQPLKFQTGVLQLNDLTTIPINNLEIYGDGIVINTRHTDDSDVIMDDFIEWSMSKLRLRKPTTKIPRKYYSQVIIDLDMGLNAFMQNFDTLSSIISKAFGIQNALHVARLAIGAETAVGMPQVHQTTWLIEPRLGQAFSSNRYFSAAPLSTPAHFELLAALEVAMERS